GFFAIGDAAYHSNPIYGRGAPSGLVQAALLDEAFERHPRDLVAAARHLDRRSEAELRPFWEAAVAGDRRVLGERRPFALTSPRAWLVGVAEQAFGWFVDRALVPAMRVDPVVFRGLLRVFNMLDPPEQLLRDPELVLRALPVLARVLRGDEPAHLFPRVERDAVLARLGSYGAQRGRRAPGAPYTSNRPPISTSWFGGIAKNSVGERALRARNRNKARRQRGSSERPVDTKVSRPRK